jgi:hypothetical protein
MGQVSGILFIFGMDALKDPASGSMTLSLVVLAGLLVLGLLVSLLLKESILLASTQTKENHPLGDPYGF